MIGLHVDPTIVLAALALSRWIEDTCSWSIREFVRTDRRYRTIEIQAGEHTVAADLLPDGLGRFSTASTAIERTKLVTVECHACHFDLP
ncbi:MAG: hypothetical protein H0X39_14370 [Actinobacteria bacterium]|nr:hypothetical protein [Actinomycetota bacterium]